MDGRPRLLRDGVRDAVNDDLLDEVEIYSQSALQQLASADHPQKRLQLIDRPHRGVLLDQVKRIERDVATLKQIGSAVRLTRMELERLRAQLRELPQVRSELAQALENRPALPPSLQEQHSQYLQRQRTLELIVELRDLRNTATGILDALAPARSTAASIRTRIASEATSRPEVPLAVLDRIDADLLTAEAIKASIAGIDIDAAWTALVSDFEQLDEAYYKQRQQQQAVSESLKREDQLRRRLAELEKADRDFEQFQTQFEDATAQRRGLRAEVAQSRETIFETRVSEADRINREFGAVVLLTVRRSGFTSPYVTRLSRMLLGSRIREQDEIAKGLATSFSATDLLQIIEDGDIPRVANVLGRDVGQVSRVLAYLRDHPDLYELEGTLLDDALDITMFDGGVPKAVDQLSEGQRATALLPLILRGSTGPLIIDQPEDDLDNNFIYEVLVKNISRLKIERQLVFVTHNANIPVLGEAESIVVMNMASPRKAAPPRTGPLDARKDDILHLLEGGREAFERREARYGKLLS
jgi:hypothetical protein